MEPWLIVVPVLVFAIFVAIARKVSKTDKHEAATGINS